MPQDSLRSVVYRSLVPCSDPNGIVEYETMKKSKSGSHKKEQKIEKMSTSKESIRSSKEKDLFSEENEEESPLQILEVSRGAQKLNMMIESWSKGVSFDGQSQDIARDLLKGALDLQESLVMLYNVQEASKFLGHKKKDHKQNSDGGVERNDSYRYLEKQHQREMQHRRLSSVEELKKVIRDSLTRQNLLSESSNEEHGASFGSKKLRDFFDNPSTSSSQSSMIHSNNSTSGRWSETSKDTKAKAPSVIAKLMGLEGYPSEAGSFEQLEGTKSMVHQRPAIGMEMQQAQRDYILRSNEDPASKTLKEVIERMHLKGLLKGSDFEGHELDQHTSSHSGSNHGLDDEMPPIVVIKPLGYSYEEKEESMSSNSSPQSRGESSNGKNNQGRDEEQEAKAMYTTFKAKEDPQTRTLLQKKPMNLKDIPHKVETKVTTIRRRTQEVGTSNSKQIRPKQEEKVRKTIEHAPTNKARPSSPPVNFKPRERDATDKNTNKVKKVIPSRKAPMMSENVKHLTMSRSPAQVRVMSTKGNKLDSGSITTKNHIQRQESTTQSSVNTRPLQSRPQSAISQVKSNATRKAKPVKEPLPTSSLINRTKAKKIIKGIKLTDKMPLVSVTINTNLEEQFRATDAAEPSELPIKDHGDEEQSISVYRIPAESSHDRSSIESAEELKQHLPKNEKNESNLKEFLLSSPSFLTSAADLFELQMKQHSVLQKTNSEDVSMMNTQHFLDCANELIERRSYRLSQYGHPWFSIYTVNQRTSISLEQLLGEVCDDFDKLKKYSEIEDETAPSDGIRTMLERDVKCKRVLAGAAWDSGWEFGFSVNEADQVLGELEEHVLSDLVQEIIVDYTDMMVQHLYF